MGHGGVACRVGADGGRMKTEPCRILLVEDDREMLELVREHLEGEGHTVTPAGLGAEAIARLKPKRSTSC